MRQFTLEHRKKLSEAHKGRKQSTEIVIKRVMARAGYKHSAETKQKIRDGLFGNENYKARVFSEQAIQKMRDKARGRKFSSATLLKMRMAKLKPGTITRSRDQMIKQNGGYHTTYEWNLLKRFCDFCCLRCGKKEPDIKLVKDHILPISRGGKNAIWNIQPLCAECNGKKWTKMYSYFGDYVANNKVILIKT